MKASELIKRLSALIQKYGDMPVHDDEGAEVEAAIADKEVITLTHYAEDNQE